MATQIKFRRDTRANLELSTPVEAEIGVDTTNDRLILGDGSTSGGVPQASYKDIQNNLFTAVDAVGTNAITLTLSDAPTAYVEYQTFTFKPAANNTGAVTVDINSLGVKNLKKDDGSGTLTDLEADDLKSGIPINIIYDGVNFIAQLGGASSSIYKSTASAVSQEDLNSVLGSENYYKLVITNIKPSVSAADIRVRFSSDGGASFITTSSYNVSYVGEQDDGSGNNFFQQNATSALIGNGLNTSNGGSMVLEFFKPSDSQHTHIFVSSIYLGSGGKYNFYTGMMTLKTTAAIDSVRVFPTSGNISGDFEVFAS